MTLRSSHFRWTWLILISVFLGLMLASCESTYDRDRMAAPDPGERTDPPRGTANLGPQTPTSAFGSPIPIGISSHAAQESGVSRAAAKRGQQLFQSSGCIGCHTVNGQGGKVGPDLSDEGNAGHSAQWLKTQIRNPKAHDPQTTMPAFDKLTGQQVNDLVDYLESLKKGQAQAGPAAPGPARGMAAQPAASVGTASLVATGGQLWGRTCGQCHNLRSPSEYSDAQWAVAVHHMRVRVPLTGQEQRDILAFLQASN